jgi:hypothetical protein
LKNKLTDLNDHLFAQIERLSDEGLTPEQIENEAMRGAAIVNVADQIIRNADMQLRAVKLMVDHGERAGQHLTMLPGAKKPQGTAA